MQNYDIVRKEIFDMSKVEKHGAYYTGDRKRNEGAEHGHA